MRRCLRYFTKTYEPTAVTINAYVAGTKILHARQHHLYDDRWIVVPVNSYRTFSDIESTLPRMHRRLRTFCQL